MLHHEVMFLAWHDLSEEAVAIGMLTNIIPRKLIPLFARWLNAMAKAHCRVQKAVTRVIAFIKFK